MKSIRLSEATRIYSGNSINERVKAQNFMGLNEGTPYIATKDISYEFQVNYENGVKIPKSDSLEFKSAKSGSVLLCAEGGSAGRKMAIIDRDVFFVNKLFCFECDDQLNSKYLFYYLQTSTFQNLFKNSITGLIGGVSLEKVRNLPITLPSIEKQHEVVTKLDSVFAEIDLLEGNLDISIEKIIQLSQSQLSDSFSSIEMSEELSKPMSNQGIAGRDELLNEFARVFTVIPDSHTKVKSSSYLESGKYAVVDQGKDLIAGYTDSNPTVNIDSLPVIVFGDHTRSVKYVDFPFAAGADGTQILKPSSLADPKYAFYLVLLAVSKIPSKGYARHFGDLKKMPFPIPSLEKQRQIVKKLDNAFTEIELLKAQIKIKKDFAVALRQSLLFNAYSQEIAVS